MAAGHVEDTCKKYKHVSQIFTTQLTKCFPCKATRTGQTTQAAGWKLYLSYGYKTWNSATTVPHGCV